MKTAKDFKSGSDFMKYFRSLSIEDKEKFVEMNITDSLLEGSLSSIYNREKNEDYSDLTYEELVKKDDGITPEQLIDFVTSGMKQKLHNLKNES